MTTQKRVLPMKYRKLRIAWSVGWGLVAVLVIAFWVRSYSWCDSVGWGTSTRYYGFVKSCIGQVSNGGSFELSSRPRRPTHHSRSTFKLIGLEFDWLGIQGFETAKRINTDTEQGFVSVNIPYWALVFLCFAIGTASWIPWHFSLRTLLIATTVVAMVLGLLMYAGQH